MTEKKNTETSAEKPIEEQAREQTGQKQVRMRINENNMRTAYANAFRASETAEEIILDFGVNTIRPAAGQQDQPEIIFQANERIIMNLYSAKRLAITLSQLIRKYEQQFGELELDVAKRRSQEKNSAR